MYKTRQGESVERTIVKPYVAACARCIEKAERKRERERERESWFLVVGCLSKLPPRILAVDKSLAVDRGCANSRISDLTPARNSLYTEVRGLSARIARARVSTRVE